MKFGKYLAKRQLDLPEYGEFFIDYKALKKLIKRLSTPSASGPLQDSKATFFFQIERELEKVNTCYLQKEAELKVRLEILIEKKKHAYAEGALSSKTSITHIFLYEAFQRFRRDLIRLEQFIELNATGFSKVLKKWDKHSQSQTREMYLTSAVEVQPAFHRDELADLSDKASTSILELDAWADGEVVVQNNAIEKKAQDDLYHEFVRTAASGAPIKSLIDHLVKLPNAKERVTRFFLLAITSEATEDALRSLLDTKLVDLHATEDLSGRNCLHKAAVKGRKLVIDVAFEANVSLTQLDSYGRTPLHYACIHNQSQLIKPFLERGVDIDLEDNDNYSALLYSILHDHTKCVQILLDNNAKVDANSETDYVPLNFACLKGSYVSVEMIFKRNPAIVPDAEGLYPIHIAARAGHDHLIPLLKRYNVNVNEIDKLNAYPAISYAAAEGHVDTVRELIKADADLSILDDKGRTALYHAAWEGHARCIAVLARGIEVKSGQYPVDTSRPLSQSPDSISARKKLNSLVTRIQTETDYDVDSMDTDLEILDLDDVPDLALPPPILPLRKYGHNYLDKNTFLMISFDPSNCLTFNSQTTTALLGGRMTISSSHNTDIIPRSLMVPISDTDRVQSFHLSSLENFSIDFDLFPPFGTRIIARTTALPYIFNQKIGSGNRQSCVLPMFDQRMKPIGELSFNFQVVKPFKGKLLEITKYETYWKSTSKEEPSVSYHGNSNQSGLSFVTASSLSGEYMRVCVCLSSDGIPVASRSVKMSIGGIEVPLALIPISKLQMDDAMRESLANVSSCDEFYSMTRSYAFPLEDLLRNLNPSINLEICILFDSGYGSKQLDLNEYADSVLGVVFHHSRELRVKFKHSRSIIFSSAYPDLCTTFNWKQPNYPVFFYMNKLHIPDFAADDEVQHQDADRRRLSLKEATTFANVNNLLGIITSSKLLRLVPTLAESVRIQGLVLVANADNGTIDVEVDGVRTRESLVFSEAISV